MYWCEKVYPRLLLLIAIFSQVEKIALWNFGMPKVGENYALCEYSIFVLKVVILFQVLTILLKLFISLQSWSQKYGSLCEVEPKW